jgi:hypothetical protein
MWMLQAIGKKEELSAKYVEIPLRRQLLIFTTGG